jgi:hypothetical protein
MTWWIFDQLLNDNLLTNGRVTFGVTLTYSGTLASLQAEICDLLIHFLISDITNLDFDRKWRVM